MLVTNTFCGMFHQQIWWLLIDKNTLNVGTCTMWRIMCACRTTNLCFINKIQVLAKKNGTAPPTRMLHERLRGKTRHAHTHTHEWYFKTDWILTADNWEMNNNPERSEILPEWLGQIHQLRRVYHGYMWAGSKKDGVDPLSNAWHPVTLYIQHRELTLKINFSK